MVKNKKQPELKELESIKNLLVLQLLKDNVPAKSIASVIGMDPADFSRDFPVKKLFPKTTG